MAVKWIITDLDGCLNPEESVPWNGDLFGEFSALARNAAAGLGSIAPLTICTGRPQPYVEVLMKIFDIRVPAICENGAVLYSLHDNRAWFGPGVTEEKIEGVRAVRSFIDTQILPDEPRAIMQFGKEAQISVFSEHPAIFDAMKARIATFVRDRGGPDLLITASHFYLNISLKGVNKGNALRALIRELNVTRDEIAGIGDTEGDLPLRETVGFFACPANATQSIKEVADYVSPSPDIAGLLDILKRPEMQRARKD
ncbi:MAG: hypothetical protein AMXMBFR84_23860 [Candidatus Hydrogenedentota bacterium]